MDPLFSPFDDGLTRRHLVRVGAVSAAGLWLSGFDRIAGLADAAVVKAPLRRSSYAGLAGALAVSVDGATKTLELVGVDDLPISTVRPELRGSDDAFRLRLRGSSGAAFDEGIREFTHPELGKFSLFVAPTVQAGGSQDYEAVIDRTVPIPGLTDEGAPLPVGQVSIRNRRRRRRRRRRHHRHRGGR